MPEVSHAVYNSRDSLHHQAQDLHAALKVQQAQLSSQLSALATQTSTVAAIAMSLSHLAGGGQLPLTIQFGAPPSGPVGVGVGVAVATVASPGGPAPAVQPVQRGGQPAAEPAQRPPMFELLPLHTTGDLWTAWKEGIGRQQAVEALEEA
jgi:hypothetical protein